VNFSAIEFTRTTLAEDREICENVQLGMEQANASKGVLNSSEIRIWEFQKAYMDLINKQLIKK
jgi:phenylpropionate dioxygenase-like ring-hydroxylating dioxygenase large terminal subunit